MSLSKKRSPLQSVVQAILTVCLLIISSPARGQFTQATLPPLQEIYRFRGDLYRGFPSDLHVNRHGQLVTVLSNQPKSTTALSLYLLNYSSAQGVSTFPLPFDHRVFSLSLSDWGSVVESVSRNSSPFKVLSAPFGAPLQELFNLPVGTLGASGINDAGVVAFASRDANNHGLRDLWRQIPGQTLESLPDVGEDSLRGPTLVDPLGRVIQSHWMNGIPPLDEATMRLEANGQWQDLTATFGESDERVFDLIGTNSINASGDFVFASGRPDGQFFYRLNAYSAATGTATQIFSSTTDLLNGVHQLSIADNGDVLFRLGDNGNGLQAFVYRKNQNALVDLASLVPAGASLYSYPAMNQNGDIFFGAWNPSTHFNYFLLKAADSVATPISAFSNLIAPFDFLALTNALQPYFWLQSDNQQWILGTAAVPEPPVSILLAMLTSLAIGRRRR